MYKEIDELVEVIIQDKCFQTYLENEKALHNEKTMALLSRHQILQENYLKLRNQSYISIEDIRNDLTEVKREMMNDNIIQNYYQSYYALQELLQQVTEIVFSNISEELVFESYHF